MRRTFSTFALVAGLSIGLNPQARPDFSGTWTMDEARSESPTHEGFAGPVTWVIRQSPEELIVEVKRGPKTATFTYRIYPKAPAGPPAGVPSYRGYWEGDRLVTETATNIQGQTVTTREVRMLEPSGNEMRVERLVQVEHGYTLRGAQNYNTAKDLFRKVAP